jgi:cytochrome P450
MTPERREAPGPRGWPWVGSLPGFARDPLRFWTHLAARYGAVARYRMGAELQFLISDPEGIAHVLQHDTVRYYRGKYHDLLKPAFGEGLLTANGEPWRQQRRLVQPAFAKNHISTWLDIVVSTTEARIAAWNGGVDASPLDIAREMAGLVQEINAKILFGRSLPYPTHPSLLDAVGAVNDSLLRQVQRAMVLGGFLNRLPLPDVRRFRAAVTLLHQTVDRLMAHYQTQGGSEDRAIALKVVII